LGILLGRLKGKCRGCTQSFVLGAECGIGCCLGATGHSLLLSIKLSSSSLYSTKEGSLVDKELNHIKVSTRRLHNKAKKLRL